MKSTLISLLLLLSTLAVAQNKKITGHWTTVSTGDSLLTMDELVKSGTVTFERIKKYNDKLYQWGGGCYNGFEFGEKGEFSFYHNTLCSTESSPVSHTDATWEMADAQTITIRGKEKNYRARIVLVEKNKLTLEFLK